MPARAATTMSTKENFNPFAAMKKLMKSLVLFAAAAMALTSCENEAMNEGIEANDTYTMTFTAGAPESKTSVSIVGDKAKFSWSVDSEGKLADRVVFLQTQDATTAVNTKYNKKEDSSVNNEGVATFVTEFEAVTDAKRYNYAAIYPAQSISGTALKSIGVSLPASQTLTEGNYDPNADLMMSQVIEGVEAKNDHGGLLKFTRLAAIGKMSLKLTGMEAGEKIEKVVITFDEKVMNGDVTLNFTEDSATYANSGSHSVTLSGSIAANADRTDIYFTCFPGEYSGAYSVEVTTDKATYSNTGKSIAEDKALSFKAGDVLGFNLTAGNRQASNIKTYTKITKTNLADYSGTYLLVYEAGNVAFDGSLATLDAASNNKGVEIKGNTITGAYSDYTFTIEKVEGGYSIKSASGSYIGRSASSNGLSTAKTYSADYLNTITNLVIKGKGGLALQYNAASDQTRFRYFTSTQKPVALYRLNGTGSDEELVKALVSIEVSGQTTTFNIGDKFAFDGTVTAKYNDNTTTTITTGYTVNSSAVKMDTAGDYTVTVTYEGKTATYTVTVKAAEQGGGDVETIVTANFAPRQVTATNKTLSDNQGNSWVFTSDAAGFTSSQKYVHAGSNSKTVSHITFTSNIKNVKSVTVNAAAKANSNASIKVYIGSTLIGTSSVLGATQDSGGTAFTVDNTNNISGALKIVVSRPSSAKGALYFNSANVTYAE